MKPKSVKDGRQIYLEKVVKEYTSVRGVSDQFPLFWQIGQALMMEVEECKQKVADSVLYVFSFINVQACLVAF